jgi:2-hydroxy-3-oxopropionate reductase
MGAFEVKPIIGFLGIGLMGRPMAINLLKAGFPLIAWNRTTAKAAELALYGAQIALVPVEAAKADVVITMLSAGPDVINVVRTIAAVMKPGSLLIDMSSTRQAEAQEIAALLHSHGVNFIDAPVSGGVVGAEAATLAIMAGGAPDQFERAKPILSVMGRPTLVGPEGCGQVAKLCNQLIVGATLNVVAEALLLAKAGGADPVAVRTAIRGGFAESRILDVHGQRMLDRNFLPGGQIKTQLKDMENILDAAANAGVKLPVTELVTDAYRSIVDAVPNADQSAVLLAVEKINAGQRVGDAENQLPS